HRPPGIHVPVDPGERPVDEVQVDVLQAEPGPGLLEGGEGLVVAVVAARQFRRHHDLLAGYAGPGDGPTHTGRVAFVVLSVDQAVVLLWCLRPRSLGRLVVHRPGAQAQGGDRRAVVQRVVRAVAHGGPSGGGVGPPASGTFRGALNPGG